jgi:hydroxymethylpyrimidine/phosphomethylpyrimidine kinase
LGKNNRAMTQITINLPNEAEAQWLVELLNRLQVPFQVDADEVTKHERAKEIIMRGANTLDAAKMHKHVKQARKDRKHPFRAE